MSNYPCPKDGCQRRLPTIGGMRAHVAKGHGDRSVYLESRICQMCEEEFETHVSNTQSTCTPSCQSKLQQKIAQEVRHGEKDKMPNPYAEYSTEWDERSSRVIQEEGECCQGCGTTNEEHREKHGRSLHVHHIHPKNKFKDQYGRMDFDRAESRDNLVPLCYKCHSKWEGIPVRPSVISS